MKTANEISNSTDNNKSEQYLDLAKVCLAKSNELCGTSNLLSKMRDEIASHFRKCESADCEYTAYINAHAAQIWFDKLSGLKSGILTIRDVL